MKNKNYSQETVTELFESLRSNIEKGKCVDRLEEIYNQINIPNVKYAIIHDLFYFTSELFNTYNSLEYIHKMVPKGDYYGNAIIKDIAGNMLPVGIYNLPKYIKMTRYCINKVGKSNNNINKVESHMLAVMKALVMTTRKKCSV